ncbi:MAG: aspartyl protease family protein [Sphingobacteriales bacterium]|nr:aspartyl protease family protein [Sphingobacteriales bacterium]
MINRFWKRCFVCLICNCTLVGATFSQNTYEFKGNRKRESIVFTKARGLVVLSTYINDKGPYNFILDSGVGLMIITDPDLKDSLNLKYLRTIQIKGLGEGNTIEAFTTPYLKVQIGSAIAKSTSAAILAKDFFNLSSYAGIPIHGLIGYEFFQSFMVRIYYDAGYITIFKNQKSRLIRKGYRIPITIEQNKPYLEVFANQGAQKKIPLKMLIDTGAGHPIAIESEGDHPFPLPDKFIQANLGVGLGGNISGFIGRIDDFRIGRFDFKNPIASFPYDEEMAAKVKGIDRNGSIGNQLLKRFEVVFDYERSCIYIRPNSNFKEPFEHDMSGMELFCTGDNYSRYFVNRVEPNSPADEFGIQKGDEILSINFKLAHKMTMDEITEMLKSKDGRNLYIEIARGDNLIRGVLTLKRRI